MKVVFEVAALEDVEAARAWYARQEMRLAGRFEDAVESNEIVVVACIHARRADLRWKSRL